MRRTGDRDEGRLLAGAALLLFCLLPTNAAPPPRNAATFHDPQLCGPIALRTACAFLDIPATLDEVTELCHYGGDDIPIAYLVSAAKAKGLEAKAYNASVAYLKRITGPAIIDLPRGHFCVLVGWKDDSAIIVDLPNATAYVPENKVSRDWGGHVIVLAKP